MEYYALKKEIREVLPFREHCYLDIQKLFKYPYCLWSKENIVHIVDEVFKEVGTRCFPLGAKREQEENIKHKYDKSYDFYRSCVYLQPHYPLEYENIPLAYEGYKIKDNYGERKLLKYFNFKGYSK